MNTIFLKSLVSLDLGNEPQVYRLQCGRSNHCTIVPVFGSGRNGCWPSRWSQFPRALPFVFSLCCPLNDHRRAAHSFFKIGRLFSLFCLSFARPHLFIILLLSGNVHPNPCPIFPCSVCAGNVTWRGKLVQCRTCSKWVYVRCSQLSLSKFRALGSSHPWSYPHL